MARLVGKSASSGRDNAAEVTDAGALKVDIGGATLSVTADGIEGLLATIDADTGSIDGKLPALQSGAVPVGDAGGSFTVDGKGYRSTVSITRPSNTTDYIAGDVIGIADGGTPANAGSAIHTLSGIGPSGGYILLQSAALLVGLASVPAGMAGFRIHLFGSSPTAVLDNAAFDLASGDRAAYMGYFDLPTPQDIGSTIYTQLDNIGRQIKLAAASSSLFAEIETRGAFTPASGTVYELRLSAMEVGL